MSTIKYFCDFCGNPQEVEHTVDVNSIYFVKGSCIKIESHICSNCLKKITGMFKREDMGSLVEYEMEKKK